MLIVKTNEIYQLAFFKVVVLNCSTKGVMSGSIRRIQILLLA